MGAGPNDTGDYPGIWKAIVVDNEDPNDKSRARVRIAGIHDSDVAIDDLPWAKICIFKFGNLHGPIRIPALNQPVWVMHEQGHGEYPVIVGGVFTGLDSRNESVEDNIAGDETRVIKGTVNQVASRSVTICTGTSITQSTVSQTISEESSRIVEGKSINTVGVEEHNVAGGSTTVIGATEKRSIIGDSITTVVGQKDENVGGDSVQDITGQVRRTANNVSGTPLTDNAVLDEAINGVYKAVAKTIAGIEGASVELDPIGVNSIVQSLVNLTVKALVTMTVDGALVRLGGASANQPVALLTHVHFSPFLGLPTTPAIDVTGVGISKTVLMRGTVS